MYQNYNLNRIATLHNRKRLNFILKIGESPIYFVYVYGIIDYMYSCGCASSVLSDIVSHNT